jgi:hypothetical protein
MRCKQWGKGAWKSPASMAMRIKFAAQIMKQFKTADFLLVWTPPLFTLRTSGGQINWHVISRKVLFAPHRFLSNKSPIHFAGASGNGNTFFNGKWHIQNENGHRLPRSQPWSQLMPNNCKNLNPPFFLLPTTWKGSKYVSRLTFIGATIQFINSVVRTYVYAVNMTFLRTDT